MTSIYLVSSGIFRPSTHLLALYRPSINPRPVASGILSAHRRRIRGITSIYLVSSGVPSAFLQYHARVFEGVAKSQFLFKAVGLKSQQPFPERYKQINLTQHSGVVREVAAWDLWRRGKNTQNWWAISEVGHELDERPPTTHLTSKGFRITLRRSDLRPYGRQPVGASGSKPQGNGKVAPFGPKIPS
jgi:hypothetical protein